jgi:O-antigen ligase
MRLVWGVCIILILAGTFATVSFTAFLSLAVSMFFTARWQMRGRYTRTIFIIVLIGVLIVGMFSPLGARFREEVLYSMRTREPFYWFSSRVLAWYVGFQVAMQRPLLGTGPVPIGVYESIAAGFLPADLVAARLARGLPLLMVPHNLYLSFATETGLPGLLAFLGLLVFTVLPLWLQVRSERAHLPGSREPTIEAALLVGLIIALFSGLLLSEHLNYKALWVLLGITSSVIRRTAERGLSVPKSIWYRR